MVFVHCGDIFLYTSLSARSFITVENFMNPVECLNNTSYTLCTQSGGFIMSRPAFVSHPVLQL